jgi:hypothetical protein
MKTSHLRSVGKFFKESRLKRRGSIFHLGALLARLHLFQLLDVFVQIQIVENNGDEKAEHDLNRNE